MAIWQVEYDQRGTYTHTYEIEADSAEEAEQALMEMIEKSEEPDAVRVELFADSSEQGIDHDATRKVRDRPREDRGGPHASRAE